MKQNNLMEIIEDQTKRALWEIKNVIDCVPDIHEENLNSLDVISSKELTRKEINEYFFKIEKRIQGYISELTDTQLLEYPDDCEYCIFTLILAQFRHLHSHMGMIMGFIIDDTGMWPRVLGLENDFPEGEYRKYL